MGPIDLSKNEPLLEIGGLQLLFVVAQQRNVSDLTDSRGPIKPMLKTGLNLIVVCWERLDQ